MQESGLCGRFPREALRFLDALIESQPWAPTELGECLSAIVQVWPEAPQDYRYTRLIEYARRYQP